MHLFNPWPTHYSLYSNSRLLRCKNRAIGCLPSNQLFVINNHKRCGHFLLLPLVLLFLMPLFLFFSQMFLLNISFTNNLQVHLFLLSCFCGTASHGQRKTKEKRTKFVSSYSNSKQLWQKRICNAQYFRRKKSKWKQIDNPLARSNLFRLQRFHYNVEDCLFDALVVLMHFRYTSTEIREGAINHFRVCLESDDLAALE